jgi:hypothetical protein
MSSFLGGTKPEINEEKLSSLPVFKTDGTGGLQLRTFWAEHYPNENQGSYMFTPIKGHTGDRQEILLQFDEIPNPTQFQCVDTNDAEDFFGPKIEFDINIEKMARAHRVKHQHVVDVTLESSKTLTPGETVSQSSSLAQATVISGSGTSYVFANLRTGTWSTDDGKDITGSLTGAHNVHVPSASRKTTFTLRRGFHVVLANSRPETGETFADYLHRLETDTVTNANNSIGSGTDETKKYNYAAVSIGNYSTSSAEELQMLPSALPVVANHFSNRNFFSFPSNESDLHSGATTGGSTATDNRSTLDIAAFAGLGGDFIEIGQDYRLAISFSNSELNTEIDRPTVTFGVFPIKGNSSNFDYSDISGGMQVSVPCSNSIPFNSKGIKEYTGDNSTTDFAIPNTFEHKSHIVVRVDGDVKERNNDYTINSSNEVVFSSAPSTGARIHINHIGVPSDSYDNVTDSTFPKILTIWLTNDMARYYATNAGASDWSTGTKIKVATGHLDSTSTVDGNSGNNSVTDKTHFGLSVFGDGTDGNGTGEDSVDLAQIKDTESIVHINSLTLKEFSNQVSNASIVEQPIKSDAVSTSLTIKAMEHKIQHDLLNSNKDSTLLAFGTKTSTQLGGDGNLKYLFFNNFNSNNLNLNSQVGDGQISAGYSHDENKLGNIFNENTLHNDGNKNGLEIGNSAAIDMNDTNAIDNFTQKGFMKLNWNLSGLNGGDDGAPFEKRECPIATTRVKNVVAAVQGNSNVPIGTVIQVDDPSIFNAPFDEEYVMYRQHGDYSKLYGQVTGKKNTVSGAAAKTISGITTANPAVVTCTAHGFNDGDCVLIESTSGTTSMNDHYFHVTKVDANSFQCTSFSNGQTYSSGGTATKVSVDMRTGLKVTKLDGDVVTFNKGAAYADYYYSDTYDDEYTSRATRTHLLADLNLDTDTNFSNILISPMRYWVFFQVQNYNAINKVNNPTWTADSVLVTADTGTVGATWNEFLFSDARGYTNAWRLVPDEQGISTLELTKDYGFGNLETVQTSFKNKKVDDVGFLNVFYPTTNEYNEIPFETIVDVDQPEEEDDITLMVSPMSTETKQLVYHSRTGTYPPMFVTVFEDELPIIDSFEVGPDEQDAFFPRFKWKSQDKDLWYGFIMVDDNNIYNQYKNAILHYPLNDDGAHGATISTAPVEQISNTTTAVSGVVYDIEGLAGNSVRFDGDDYVRSGTGSADPFGGELTEASFVMHVIHDNANIAADQHILYKDDVIEVKVNSSDIIVAHLYWDANSYVELTSTSLMIADGETPMNIIVTLDTTLTSGNAKLFVNGKLEDQTGLAIAADATGAQTGWLRGTNLETNTNQLFIGSANGSTGWDGKIEEVVVYNKAIYPFTGKDSEFLFTKPVKELQETTVASSKSYVGKIFLKDYHNIRGKTVKEVATAPQVSFKKAAFRIDGA